MTATAPARHGCEEHRVSRTLEQPAAFVDVARLRGARSPRAAHRAADLVVVRVVARLDPRRLQSRRKARDGSDVGVGARDVALGAPARGYVFRRREVGARACENDERHKRGSHFDARERRDAQQRYIVLERAPVVAGVAHHPGHPAAQDAVEISHAVRVAVDIVDIRTEVAQSELRIDGQRVEALRRGEEPVFSDQRPAALVHFEDRLQRHDQRERRPGRRAALRGGHICSRRALY